MRYPLLIFVLAAPKLYIAMPIVVQQSPDFAANPDLLKRLIYSKYLFNRSRLLQREGNELASAEAILTAHDSIEILIRVIADFVQAKQSDNFMGQLKSIEKQTDKEPPYMSAMNRLNHLRVGFKHKGNVPNPTNVAELMPFVAAFCKDATAQYLAIDFEAISLAHLIQKPKARARVIGAEKSKAEGRIDAALVKLRVAFDILREDAYEKHKSILLPPIRFAAGPIVPGLDAAFSPLIKTLKLDKVILAVQQLVDTMNGILMGIQPAKLRRFSQTAPVPIRVGVRLTVKYVWPHKKPSDLTDEDFDFCRQFVIDFALRLASGY